MAITEIDSLEHDTTFGIHNSLVAIDSTHLILAYSGADSHGYVKTFSIDGSHNLTEIDSLEHDTSTGSHNSLIMIDSTHFVLAYRGTTGRGILKTFSIDGSYNITQIDSLDHGTSLGTYNSLVMIDSTHFMLAYSSSVSGRIKTFSIDGNYDNITEIDYYVHDGTNGEYNSLVKIDSTHFMLAYSGLNDDGYIKVFGIDGSYNINYISQLEHDTANGKYNSLLVINSTHFLLSYQSDYNDGYLKSFSIDGSYVITEIDSLAFDSNSNGCTSLIKITSSHYALAYTGYSTNDIGEIKTYSVDGSYNIAYVEGLEHDSNDNSYSSLTLIDNTHLCLACGGPGDDGYIKTFSMTDYSVHTPSTFHIREDVVVNTTNGTVYDPHIDVSFGGVIKSTTNGGACTFNHDFNNEGVAGHTGHTGTITITGTVTGCGEYLGGYSSFEPSACGGYAYVTHKGLDIVTHRLMSDLINGGNAEYSGRLSTARLWYDYNSDGDYDAYIDVPLVSGYADETDDIVPHTFDTRTDEDTGVSYDVVEVDLKFIIPQYKETYIGSLDAWSYISASTEIHKIEILTENDKVFATATNSNNPFYTLAATTRYEFNWRIVLGNDLNPHEWSQWSRSAITQFGLHLSGNRLIYDQNRSPSTTGPFGVQIQSYGSDKVLDSTLSDFKCYWYDASDSGGTWKVLTTSVVLADEDVLMVLAPNVFTSMYLDFDTFMVDGTLTTSYYDGSAWTVQNAIGDGTREFAQDGYIEFHAPHDWETCVDPVAGSVTGYAIKFTVDAGASFVAPDVSLDSSYIYYAEVDATNSDPENLLSVRVSDVSIPLLGKSERSVISASFSGNDIGRKVDSTGYLISGDIKRVRGTALTSYDPLVTEDVGPVYVASASVDTALEYKRLKFSSTTYPLKPDILMMVRDNADGKIMKIATDKLDVDEDTGYWYMYICGVVTGHTYELWYVPKYLSTADWDLYKVHSVFGKERGYTRPSEVYSGLMGANVFGMEPYTIINQIENNRNTPWKDFADNQRHYWNPPGVRSETERGKLAGLKLYEDYKTNRGESVWALDLQYNSTVTQLPDTINYTDTEFDATKHVIKTGGKSLVFSYLEEDNYMACIMSFPAPTYMGENALKLDLAFYQNTMQKTLGSDVYVYRGDGEGYSWQQIGSFAPRIGRSGTFFDRYDITSDSYMDDRMIYVLIVSKYPQFSNARGLIMPGDVTEEDLSTTYQAIYNKYNGSNEYNYDNLVQPFEFKSNKGFYDILYARMVGATSNSGNAQARYVEGIDYIVDDTNHRIEILDNADIYSENSSGNYPKRSLQTYRMPKIGFQTDLFTHIGCIDSDAFGKFSNGEYIQTDPTDGDFNFKFALSKIPYMGKGMVYAIINKEFVETTTKVDIKWDSDCEYGVTIDYADNRIKDANNGNGCYIAEIVNHGGANRWLKNRSYIYQLDTVVVADGVITLDNFPYTDTIPDSYITDDPDSHGLDNGIVRLYNTTTATDIWNQITDVTEDGVISSGGLSNGNSVEVGYYIDTGAYVPGTVSITYPYLMDNGYKVIYIEDVSGYVFSKTWFEHNTFHPSFQLSNRDILTIGTQIDVKWPTGLEPYIDIEAEDE